MISIIIPYKSSGCDRRFANYLCVKNYYEHIFPKAEIVIGQDNSGENVFCRSHAINDGVSKSNGDIIIISDADLILDKQYFLEAINLSYDFVIPFGQVMDLSKNICESILTSYILPSVMPKGQIRDMRGERFAGGIQVITRELFDKVGGYDERFIGWGWEDSHFCWKILAQSPEQYLMIDEGIAYHLWHEHGKLNWNNYHLAQSLKKELGDFEPRKRRKEHILEHYKIQLRRVERKKYAKKHKKKNLNEFNKFLKEIEK